MVIDKQAVAIIPHLSSSVNISDVNTYNLNDINHLQDMHLSCHLSTTSMISITCITLLCYDRAVVKAYHMWCVVLGFQLHKHTQPIDFIALLKLGMVIVWRLRRDLLFYYHTFEFPYRYQWVSRPPPLPYVKLNGGWVGEPS